MTFLQKSFRILNNEEKYWGAGREADKNICRTKFACRISKDTDSNSEYVIFTNYPLQKYLHVNASKLHDNFIACLVFDAVHKLYLQSYICCSIEVTTNLILPQKSTNNF